MMQIQDEQVVVDPTRPWWTSVLASPVGESSPASVTLLSMPQESDAYALSRMIQPEQDRPERIADADDLMGHGNGTDRSSLGIPSTSADQSPLSLQTVIGTFESESRAQIAANYLASFEHIRSSAVWVLAPRMRARDADDEPGYVADVYWDDPYWEPVHSALSANRAVLILIVDESETNRARAILAEDTGSLQTAVLPRPPRYLPVVPPTRQATTILSALPVLE